VERLWGGRFAGGSGSGGGGAGSPGGKAISFTASLPFDRRLWREDLAGSRAHAEMLAACGIISAEDGVAIARGLDLIAAEIEEGVFPFRLEDEDIHLNIERRLTELIGPVGGKLHTARSRNDQVAVDTHLFVRREIDDGIARMRRLQGVLVDAAAAHQSTILPGYTHLQHAQPVLLAHHLLAYFWMFQRDVERLLDCRRRADLSPLGAAALAGTSFPIDPAATAARLGFAGTYANSLDAVSDRDYVLEFIAAAALIMTHLSRLAGELVLWSSDEFGFVELDDAYATGSSIMPQKKNPDTMELVRGKAGRVFGHLVGLLSVVKGLPLAYHSDLQEDKEALFDTVDTLEACLEVTAGAVSTMTVRAERMRAAAARGFPGATDLADYLTRRGLPFREAHAVVGRVVRYCLEQGKELFDLSLAELAAHSPLADEGARAVLRPEAVVKARRSPGGTAPREVARQLVRARRLLARSSHQPGDERDT
jgi:argininosuccinate lyase